MVERSGWTLNRLLVLVVLGGFAMILVEVRYLHDEVLGHHTIAWAPILYSGLMTASIVVAQFFWDRGGRRFLFWAFAAALIVGPTGYWFHNDGRPWRGLERELVALTRPIGHAKPGSGEHRHDHRAPGPSPGAAATSRGESAGDGHEPQHEEEGGGPPALAPLSIAGLGLVGMLACARRFQPILRLE